MLEQMEKNYEDLNKQVLGIIQSSNCGTFRGKERQRKQVTQKGKTKFVNQEVQVSYWFCTILPSSPRFEFFSYEDDDYRKAGKACMEACPSTLGEFVQRWNAWKQDLERKEERQEEKPNAAPAEQTNIAKEISQLDGKISYALTVMSKMLRMWGCRDVGDQLQPKFECIKTKQTYEHATSVLEAVTECKEACK